MQPSLHDAAVRASLAVIDTPLTMRELINRCSTASGLEDYSPLLAQKYLLLDVTGADEFLASTEWAEIACRLRRLPVPVLAVGGATVPLVCSGVDVLLGDAPALAAVIKNINAHPLVAMTLVQLLRHNEDVAPEQGLFAESLAYASLQGGADFKGVITQLPQVAPALQTSGDAVLTARANDELHITLNRPHARNAYNTAMRDGLYEALQILQSDNSLQRAVVRGAGDCFCVGGDLREFGTATDTALAHAIRSTRSVGQLLLTLAGRLEFSLHRACIGSGIELPAFGARVVADKNTFFQLPEITLGLIPGAGGTVSIARRIGRHRTAYLALSARRINARTALQWGLIDALA